MIQIPNNSWELTVSQPTGSLVKSALLGGWLPVAPLWRFDNKQPEVIMDAELDARLKDI